MATPSRILVWRIPWTEDPGGLQYVAFQRVGHDQSDLVHVHNTVICIMGIQNPEFKSFFFLSQKMVTILNKHFMSGEISLH